MISGIAPFPPSSSSPPLVCLSVWSSLSSCSSAEPGPRGLVSVLAPGVLGKRLMVRLYRYTVWLQTFKELSGQVGVSGHSKKSYASTSRLVLTVARSSAFLRSLFPRNSTEYQANSSLASFRRGDSPIRDALRR